MPNTATNTAGTPAVDSAQANLASQPNPKLTAAIALARYGFSVFPLAPNSKTPLISGWQNLATNDERQIQSWWQQTPEANIGIATENLLVVDVDPRNGGVETFRALVETGGLIGEEFPNTLAARTRADGTHMFYGLPPHTTVRGGANRLGAGVDVKSHGGYVVGAGSTIDDKVYHWKRGYGPGEKDLAWAPAWLIEKCNAVKPKSADAGKVIAAEDDTAVAMAKRYIHGNAPEATQGGRDNTAFSVAARLYDFGVTRETAQELLAEWNEQYCHPPLEPDEIERVAWSAQRNRENAIGAKHPAAPGFEAVEIADARIKPGHEAAPRPRLYRLTYHEAADQALDNAGEPLIEGLLDRAAMSVWYGESNSGKTFVMLDVAWHIAAGRPWADRPTRKGASVYVAAEGGRGIFKRVRALRERHPEALDVPLYSIPCAVDLLRPDADLKPLTSEIKAIEAESGKVELIVIDTLSRAIAGGNENDSQDMGVFVAHLDALRQGLSAHVAVVHHTGKDKAKGARGHSLLRAATDTEIEIDNRTVTVTKQRDMDGDLSLPFRLKPARLGVSKTGKDVTSCTVVMGNAGERPEPIALQPRLATLMGLIEDAVEEQRDEQMRAMRAFNFKLIREKIIKSQVAKLSENSSDNCPPRTTLLTQLSELSEKGWIKKIDRDQWVVVNVEIVGNVENQQVQLSKNVGTLRGRHSDKTRRSDTGQIRSISGGAKLSEAAPADCRVGA